MADVFVSYARDDCRRAEAVVEAITAHGWSVWWDRKIRPGDAFSDVIARELARAGCVVVLWSRSSVSADWVLVEAAEAARRGILIPAMLEDVPMPLEFRRRQAADLTSWRSPTSSPEFDSLLEAIAARVGTPAKSGEMPRRRPSGRWWSSRMTAELGVAAGIIMVLTLQLPRNTIPRRPNDAATATSTAAERDAIALTEMRRYEMRDYGDANIDPATFGRTQEWSPDWELRFADSAHAGKNVHIYHVTNRHHHDIRFVARIDVDGGIMTGWQPTS